MCCPLESFSVEARLLLLSRVETSEPSQNPDWVPQEQTHGTLFYRLTGEGVNGMIEETVIVQSEVGLHARPAALFVQSASRFKSNITLEANGRKANGKSILQVLSLGAKRGDILLIRAEGDDQAEAVRTLVELASTGNGTNTVC